MYNKYSNTLKKECGVDFTAYTNALRVAGNTPGIYTDVAMMLYKVASSQHVNSIIEFGSGMSTCILAKAAKDHGKEFMAMEHMRKWYDITANCMRALNISTEGYVCTDSDPENFITYDSPIDVAWIDGPIAHEGPGGITVCRLGACDWYGEQLKDAVLLFDDAQVMPNIHPWLDKFGRKEELSMWYNPTGRVDRHIFISFPTENHPLKSVIQSCVL